MIKRLIQAARQRVQASDEEDDELHPWSTTRWWPDVSKMDPDDDPAKEAFERMTKEVFKSSFPASIATWMESSIFQRGLFEYSESFLESFESRMDEPAYDDLDSLEDIFKDLQSLGASFFKLHAAFETSLKGLSAMSTVYWSSYETKFEDILAALIKKKVKTPAIRLGGAYEEPVQLGIHSHTEVAFVQQSSFGPVVAKPFKASADNCTYMTFRQMIRTSSMFEVLVEPEPLKFKMVPMLPSFTEKEWNDKF